MCYSKLLLIFGQETLPSQCLFTSTSKYFLADVTSSFLYPQFGWIPVTLFLVSHFPLSTVEITWKILNQPCLYSEIVYCFPGVMAEFNRFFLSVTWFLLWKINRGGLFFCRIPKLNEWPNGMRGNFCGWLLIIIMVIGPSGVQFSR